MGGDLESLPAPTNWPNDPDFDYFLLEGKEIPEPYPAIVCSVIEETVLLDYLRTTRGNLICSSKFINLIKKYTKYAKFIPVTLVDESNNQELENKYFLLNFIKKHEVFDLSKSTRFSGKARINKLVVDQLISLDAQIVLDTEHSLIVCNEEFVKNAEILQILGCRFVPVEDFKL